MSGGGGHSSVVESTGPVSFMAILACNTTMPRIRIFPAFMQTSIFLWLTWPVFVTVSFFPHAWQYWFRASPVLVSATSKPLNQVRVGIHMESYNVPSYRRSHSNCGKTCSGIAGALLLLLEDDGNDPWRTSVLKVIIFTLPLFTIRIGVIDISAQSDLNNAVDLTEDKEVNVEFIYAHDEETAEETKKRLGGSTSMVMYLDYPKYKSANFAYICALGSTIVHFPLLALVGVFYPYNRGSLFTSCTGLVIYALTAGIAGYTAEPLSFANWKEQIGIAIWYKSGDLSYLGSGRQHHLTGTSGGIAGKNSKVLSFRLPSAPLNIPREIPQFALESENSSLRWPWQESVGSFVVDQLDCSFMAIALIGFRALLVFCPPHFHRSNRSANSKPNHLQYVQWVNRAVGWEICSWD
ncbi:hypothetical protein NC652_018231 [Populus alba x Populus x berolinensis]|nr:hypothetical protein NC652_018231 [Populus alba x Populus x berolinensis]